MNNSSTYLLATSPSAVLPVITGPTWPGVRYFYTTRQGGEGNPPYDTLNVAQHVGDRPEIVQKNRQLLRKLLPNEPLWLRQTHSTNVVDADKVAHPDADGVLGTEVHPHPNHEQEPNADAAVTTTPKRVVAIMTADCLPVLIVHAQGRALGVAHAGWRGLANGILENTVEALQHKCPHATQWRAWIGPSIGPTAFEVEETVIQALAQHGPLTRAIYRPWPGRKGKWQVNLSQLAALRLREVGVETIHQSNRCTFLEHEYFFSYRRDGKTGRMALFAWLEGSSNHI